MGSQKKVIQAKWAINFVEKKKQKCFFSCMRQLLSYFCEGAAVFSVFNF